MTTTVFISIPGSRRSPADEPADPSPAGLTSGRFTEQQLLVIPELVEWWINRRAADDSPNPTASLIGGIDQRGTVRTTGTTANTLALPTTLAVPAGGLSIWIHAVGIPTNIDVHGELYSLVGLCHFYFHPVQGWYSRYATLGRTPTWVTSTEVRAVLTGTPPGETPIIQIVGVASTTIDWTADLYLLEL